MAQLVHSSTLVTAEVYLLVRIEIRVLQDLFIILLLIYSLTLFMAGTCANFEFDLKKNR